jgi:hypothetical protein
VNDDRQDRQVREIRIIIQAGSKDIARGQEVAVRSIFEHYFTKEGYRVAMVMVATQLVAGLVNIIAGGTARSALLAILVAGVAQAALRGLILLRSSPPEPPPAPGDSPGP